MLAPFSIARLPRIEFGAGALRRLPDIAALYGRRLLLVSGRRSFLDSPSGGWLLGALRARGFWWETVRVVGEPSPALVDDVVAGYRAASIDAVLAVGGGSVLDAGKAVAGLLRSGASVMDHLEGVGPEKPYKGPATPLIAVPTTAGTGSEATKNAVLTVHGTNGFKKSFRDEALVAEYAVVDPDLLAGCPSELVAANGMDCFTQLLEAYVSLRANPLTDALAESGMRAVRGSLLPWFEGDRETEAATAEARSRMAYAALLSGICLAQTGLGSVHGLAQPLGSYFPIPHGVVCGTLVAAATKLNVDCLQAREPESPALAKYARAGRLLGADPSADEAGARVFLVHTLNEWTRRMALPALSRFGVSEADFPRIVAASRGSSMKTNPVVLSDEEIGRLLAARL